MYVALWYLPTQTYFPNWKTMCHMSWVKTPQLPRVNKIHHPPGETKLRVRSGHAPWNHMANLCTSQCQTSFVFTVFSIFWLGRYNKTLNDWPHKKQWVLFPSTLNVSLGFACGDIKVTGKQNSLFCLGPVIKCIIVYQVLLHECTYLMFTIKEET